VSINFLHAGFGHWNAAGREVAGKLIAQYLCRKLD